MAQIPDYQSVGVANPSGRAPQARRSGAAPVAQALGEVANVVGRIGEEKYKQATDLATAMAKNEYLRSSIDIANKVQEDPDYNNWQKQYEDGANQAAAAAGANIRDPIARKNFQLEAQAEGIRTSAAIAGKAKLRFKETKVIGLNQSFEENQKALLATDDPEAQKSLMVGTSQLYDAAAADGTITPEQARAQKKAFIEGFAKSKAEVLDPFSRYKALSAGLSRDEKGQAHFAKTGTFADFIPDAERLKMIDAAELDQQQQQALADKEEERRLRSVQDDMLKRLDGHKLTASDILNSPLRPFGMGSKDEFRNMLIQQQKQDREEIPTKDDPGLVHELFHRIHLADGDPNKITDDRVLNQYFGHGINKFETLNQLRNEQQGQNTVEGSVNADLEKSLMSQAQSKLVKTNPFTGLMDPNDSIGKAQLGKFTAFYLQRKQAALAAGQTMSQFLDSSGKDYIGNYIDKFRLSQTDAMAAARAMQNAQRAKPAIPVPAPIAKPGAPRLPSAPVRVIPRRNPGETPEQFLNRSAAQ